VRRSAVFKSIKQESELLPRFLVAESQHLEHQLLDLLAVDPYRSPSYLDTVDNQVVGIGPNLARIGFHQAKVIGIRRSERMVHCIIARCLIIPFKKRKIKNPEGSKHISISQAKPFSHFKPEHGKSGKGILLLSCKDQKKIARTGTGILNPKLHIFRAIKLVG